MREKCPAIGQRSGSFKHLQNIGISIAALYRSGHITLSPSGGIALEPADILAGARDAANADKVLPYFEQELFC